MSVLVWSVLLACGPQKTTIGGDDTAAVDDTAPDTGADTVPYTGPRVLLNELMADKVADETEPARTGDWIELLNAGDSPVSLDTYAINAKGTTALEDAIPFSSGVTLGAGEHLLVYGPQFDGQTVQFTQKLNLSADTVTLYQVDTSAGTLAEVDSVSWSAPIDAPDSYARTPDGGDTWAHDPTPTPGSANQ